ncbi:hypothetical protein Plec18167_006860 [Paecilomyces lecythidis]|uniref:YCII-related domain-containing protein n=1 Tax=Paecilomyces lecythidis TaxID=3004212 RepID=A0ABR3X9B4_9EURO
MASASTKKEFLCIVPDKPGVGAKRIEIRPSHLTGLKPLLESGSVVAGGAMFEEHPAEGQTPNFKGSMIIAVANSAAEVKEIISNDIYAKEGVWDVENAQIIPFKSAVRLPIA